MMWIVRQVEKVLIIIFMKITLQDGNLKGIHIHVNVVGHILVEHFVLLQRQVYVTPDNLYNILHHLILGRRLEILFRNTVIVLARVVRHVRAI